MEILFVFNNFRCVDENRFYGTLNTYGPIEDDDIVIYYGSMEIYIPLVVLLLIFIILTIILGCRIRQMNKSPQQPIVPIRDLECASDERRVLYQKDTSLNNEIVPNINIEMRVKDNSKDEFEARQSCNDPNNLE